MTMTVYLDGGSGNLAEYEADEATEYLSARGVWWKRSATPEPSGRLIYEPSAAPHVQPSKHEWTAQLADDDSWSMGPGARRELHGD
ncbi:hypothetical protein [Microbacterium sp. cx-59]|uniref:hypothetical protein n=1 Tax=Microbacterium sp. cx-59 TaxID=2891207 RepID=UPI001E44B417|nr:hypothetical protein [Microbacterium sp. cx-59]MCC4906989.1 hypothetical protein [Microbacterium sp. cx-59]